MAASWTFGRKVGSGFALTLAFAVLIAAVAIYALRTAVARKDRVIAVNAHNLIDAQELRAVLEGKSSASRGFLITSDPKQLEIMREARSGFAATAGRLKGRIYTSEGRRLLGEIETAESAHQTALEQVIALRTGGASVEEVASRFESDVVPRRKALDNRIQTFVSFEERLLEDEKLEATRSAESASLLVVAIAVAAVLLGAAIAFFLTRTITRQVGSAVQHVQSSSAELQAAANQQATAAKEQATATSQIGTTISELLATSRQIAESSQRVAQIAEETTAAARAGDLTVQSTQDSVAGIKQQVDIIVGHMLELGKKSQQIGGVLEIINELAEQTNILAINAAIEGAGAGEAGKRFGVVAEEIRKLADRVGGSTKEIRGLVEEVRGAVNATIMATEGGAKAVDAGARQFGEVAGSFNRIAALVGTTTEAAREIELSTKQQTSAVEQVNAAISNVAQVSKETEASSGQTLQTASQLVTLSQDLTRLIRANGRA